MDAGPAADTAPVPTQPSEAERYQHALQAAQAMKGQPGMLSASARPGEPVTTGMPFGPGGGPEVLGMRPRGHPTGNLMRQLANATGDTYLRDLVERAGL